MMPFMINGERTRPNAVPGWVTVPLVTALFTVSAGYAAQAADGAADSAAAECNPASVTVTAPAAGAVLAAGPLILAGTTGAGGSTVIWTVRDGAGAAISSGSTVSAADADGTFTAPLALATGSYTVELRAGAAPDDTCPASTAALEVAAGGAPRWAAGAAGEGVPDGSFAAWRGSPVPMAGTWANSNDGQLALWPLHGEYAAWTGDLDIAIGAIDRDAGETWAAAAQGAYDQRWSQSLQEMARLWSGRPGTLYIRFAHEFNGNWYPWSVPSGSVGDFIAAWQRFRALQQQFAPAAKLVFAPNSETAGDFGTDWREAYPGPGQADVVSTSYFNAWPFTRTSAEFHDLALRYDQFGGPRGIQRHLEFARSVGLPFAVSEWSNYIDSGDTTAWIEQMYGFFNANAGTGPGQVRYEILFNELRDGNGFAVFPETNLPNSARAYADLW